MNAISDACDELFDLCTGKLYLGVSGGQDSTVLLHAVAAAACRRGELERVVAVHIDHGLDVGSASWASRCSELAAELGVGFEMERVQLASGSNLEARARAARYGVFESLLDGQDLLVLAHHSGDQTESRLMHLLQGRGLFGMPKIRALGEGRVVRPLLAVDHETIAGYSRSHELTWIEDPSNVDVSLDRNFLRHDVLPPLLARFPDLPRRLAQLSDNAAATGQAVVLLAGLDRQPLPMTVLDDLTRPARLSVLRQWLLLHGVAGGVSQVSLGAFLDQLDTADDRQPVLETPAGRLVRYRRQLYLVVEPPALDEAYPLKVPGSLELPHGVVEVVDHPDGSAAGSSVVRLEGPIRVSFLPVLSATLNPARIRIGGQNRRPRELMRDAGIPPWARDTWPLVLDGRGLAAMPGIGVRDPIEAARAPGGADEPIMTMDIRWTPDVR